MGKLIIIIISAIAIQSNAATKSAHRWFGVERGLSDGFSWHFAPSFFDIGLSYGISSLPATGSPLDSSTTESFDLKQTALRLGAYSSGYGIDSFYLNAIFGQIQMTTTRNSTSLGKRSGTSTGNFTAPGLGYHWFWEHFNLRLGFAYGTAKYPKTEFRNSSGALIETGYPNTFFYDVVAIFDLGIGWAF